MRTRAERSGRGRSSLAIAAVTFMLLAGAPTAARAGDASNAELCRQGGWRLLLDEQGAPFANQGGCVSYAARGGALHPRVADACANGNWANLFPQDGAGTPASPAGTFPDEGSCSAWVLGGGETGMLDVIFGASGQSVALGLNVTGAATGTAGICAFDPSLPLSIHYLVELNGATGWEGCLDAPFEGSNFFVFFSSCTAGDSLTATVTMATSSGRRGAPLGEQDLHSLTSRQAGPGSSVSGDRP